MTATTQLGQSLRAELRDELAAVAVDARHRIRVAHETTAQADASTADAAHRAAQAWSTPTRQAPRGDQAPPVAPPSQQHVRDDRDHIR